MKKVIFICTGNSCRSQIAEGFLRHYGSASFESCSAGTDPGFLNPFSVLVMSELGIDISHQKSEAIDEYIHQQFDYVITVCANAEKNCPVFPGQVIHLHWPIEDPVGAIGDEDKIIEAFRSVRNELADKIQEFINNRI